MSIMLLLAAIIIAFTSNLDNLGFGLAYGMRSQYISLMPNLIIASVTMLATGFSIYLGSEINQIIPITIVNICGGIVIAGIGIFTIFGEKLTVLFPATFPRQMAFNHPSKESHRESQKLPFLTSGYSKGISLRQAVVIGMALSCNNVVTGVASGAAGIPLGITTILAGILSLICVGGGSRLGSFAGTRIFGNVAPLAAGLLLIAIGIKIAMA